MSLSWEPQRKGHVYCAPACGAHCRHASFVAATKAADRLAKAMGPDWKPRVWENLGWFWCVESGALAVYPRGYGNNNPTEYDVSLDGGRWWAHGRKPESIIRRVVAMARAEMRRIEASIASAEARS